MAKVCVVPHSGAHARLSQLEQNGGAAADEYGHRIAEHTPTDGIGTKDAGIAGRLEIINVLSASWRIGQAQDHSLQPYPGRTQDGHPVEARNRGCGRVLDSGHHRSPHYTDSATKGFYRIYQTSCRISFVAAGYWSDLGSMPDIHSLSINTIAFNVWKQVILLYRRASPYKVQTKFPNASVGLRANSPRCLGASVGSGCVVFRVGARDFNADMIPAGLNMRSGSKLYGVSVSKV